MPNRLSRAKYKYCNLHTEEKLPIASNDNPKDLLQGQKSLMFVELRKVGYLVDKLQINFVLILSYLFAHLFTLDTAGEAETSS